MDYEKYRYFIVTGGEPLKAIEDWRASVETQRKVAMKLKKALGAEAIFHSGYAGNKGEITAAGFKNPPGTGWRHYKRDEPGVYRPDKTKAGKVIAEKLRAADLPSTESVCKAFRCEGVVFCPDMRIRSPGFMRVGKQYVVHIPKDAKRYRPPAGFESIPLSRYIALREKREQEKTARKARKKVA